MTNRAVKGANERRRAASELLLAREMSGFILGDQQVDVRGWRVYANDAELVGRVESLFVDIHTRVVRYLGVALTDPKSRLPTGTVLVPVGMATRPLDRRVVLLNGLSATQLALAPRTFARPVTRADEDAVLAAYGMATSLEICAADFYARPAFTEEQLLRADESCSTVDASTGL